MSIQALNLLIGTALTDREFCRRLLECPDQREELVEAFDVSPEERALILDCRECTLEGLASVLDDWATRHATPSRSFAEDRADQRYRLYAFTQNADLSSS
jgi:hypothetical protein